MVLLWYIISNNLCVKRVLRPAVNRFRYFFNHCNGKAQLFVDDNTPFIDCLVYSAFMLFEIFDRREFLQGKW